MKKLKIFLMLSILLCFGLFLNNNVSASPSTITNLTGTKWLLPEDLNSTSYIANSFDIDISPYEIELNTLLKLNYPFYVEEMNSITTWEELLDIVPYLITDIGGTNVVNNLVVEDDKNNYLIVPTRGYLIIHSYEDGGYLYYGLDLATADNLPIVSGTLTYDHPIDGTVSVSFLELYHFFFSTSSSTSFWTEMPIPPYGTMLDPLLSTITITGGDDVTNPTLIAWLEANATQIIEPSNAKPFEVGDVLPATTQLRISWIGDITDLRFKKIRTNNGNLELIYTNSTNSVYINTNMDNDVINYEMWEKIYDGNESKFVEPYTNYNGSHAYIDIDTSTWPISYRTVHSMDSVMNIFTWEDLNSSSDDYPKVLKEGDVLPAGYIKISWDFTDKPVSDGDTFSITSTGDLFIQIDQFDQPYYGYYTEIYINYELFIGDTPGYTIISLTEPVTITDVGGTSDYNVYIGDSLVWEVLPPEYLGDYDDLYDGELLDIEEDYILPEGQIGIKLLYNNTGSSKSGTIIYTFGTWGRIKLTAQEDNTSTQVTSAEISVFVIPDPNAWGIYLIDGSLANQTFGYTRGNLFAGILLDFSGTSTEERTITDITVNGDLDIDVIFTRILTEEEIAYQEGYSNGYTTAREIFGWKDGDDWYNGIDAWNLGEKYARELYGFYDSTTDEWLSVSDYIARYGTGNGNGNGSPGASNFYANFDKYFIPAMIIVFGGAIVLTILKVFKGRE